MPWQLLIDQSNLYFVFLQNTTKHNGLLPKNLTHFGNYKLLNKLSLNNFVQCQWTPTCPLFTLSKSILITLSGILDMTLWSIVINDHASNASFSYLLYLTRLEAPSRVLLPSVSNANIWPNMHSVSFFVFYFQPLILLGWIYWKGKSWRIFLGDTMTYWLTHTNIR